MRVSAPSSHRDRIQLDPRQLPTAALLVLIAAASPEMARADPLDRCLADLRAQAPGPRVSVADFDRLTAGVQILERVVSGRASQAEVVDFWWNYVPRLVDERRVREGREVVARWGETMAAIEARYGVDRSVFTAIWGVETNYGAIQGSLPLLDVWVTRACTEQRPLWRANVFTSLRLAGRSPGESLRFALICLAPAGFWAGYHLWRAGATIRDDELRLRTVTA